MGHRANYKCGALAYKLVCRLYFVSLIDMWDLKAFPGKIERFRPTEIKFESNFSNILQHLISTEYSTFLIAKKFED